jgi:SAM-dependent methyltransferase
LCDSQRVALAVPLARSAIADAYLPPQLAESSRERFPLDLYLCLDCGHVQLLDVMSPEILFRDYTYRTASSPSLVEHFRQYADEVRKFAAPANNALVVEVGSNDGTFLRFFREHGLTTLGVDPARRIAAEATQGGIETIPDYFTAPLAAEIARRRGQAAIVAANNVFAHVDSLGDVADGVRRLLSPDGVFVFEVSYLVDIVDRMLFDTVYHEHLCYHSVKPLVRFLARQGMTLIDVRRISSKGGSIRCFAQRDDSPRPARPSVAELLALEESRGFDRLETFQRFSAQIGALKEQVRHELRELRAADCQTAGFGASATVTTLLHQFELAEFLGFLVDDNSSKWGLLSPGHHLEVRSPRDLSAERVGCVLILAWAYAQPIMQRHRWFQEQGGRFLVPLPTVQMY